MISKYLKFILWPIALFYGLGVGIRHFLYEWGWLKSKRYKMPVIVIGNLSTGGSGKTPLTEYLIDLLLKKNYSISVVSRGYKRKTKGFIKANKENAGAASLGDEPYQMFKKFHPDVQFAVSASRIKAIDTLIKTTQPDVFLLDDAFQHRSLTPGLSVLLTPYQDLYVDDYLLPFGHLREFRCGAKRANIIVVTKCPEDLTQLHQNKIKEKLKLNAAQKLYFSAIEYDICLQNEKERRSIDYFIKKKHLLITGIANPKPFVDFLEKSGLEGVHRSFSDHHSFSKKQIDTFYNWAKTHHGFIITTEKDFVRLQMHSKLKQHLYYLPIKTRFLTKGFNQTIINYVEKN